MTVQSQRFAQQPFGTPDGSRAAMKDIIDAFVEFGSAYGGIATTGQEMHVRVFVGKMGAGKTVYLRRLQDHASQQDSVFADQVSQDLPTTDQVIDASHNLRGETLTEKWRQIWNRSILLSLASYLLYQPRLRDHFSPSLHEDIGADYRQLFPEQSTKPRTIYSQLRWLITKHQGERNLTDYIERPQWDDLERSLGDAIADSPPLFYYLDAIDDEFAHAPMYWLRCQKGLFYAVMRLLRDSRLGSRLHVVISMRDVVLSSVYRSEHATRYKDEPHIRVLSWNYHSVRRLLEEKIASLPPEYIVARGDGHASTVEEWLGFATIDNVNRGTTEDTTDYLIRHTRLLPRDIVHLGNAVCNEIRMMKARGASRLEPADIRRVVAQTARFLGDAQLSYCANHIASDVMPKGAASRGYSEVYTSVLEYADNPYYKNLKELIGGVGRDRFSVKELDALEQGASERFQSGGAEGIDILSILWQHNLIGYEDRSNELVFYSLDDMYQFSPPRDMQTYVFHPCVIDSVGIEAVGPDPVYPYSRPVLRHE